MTLVRRASLGERLAQAHRTHLYQRLANDGWGHAPVSLLYGAMAALGIAVASARALPNWEALLVAYLLGVLAVGMVLNRRVRLPPPGSTPASPVPDIGGV